MSRFAFLPEWRIPPKGAGKAEFRVVKMLSSDIYKVLLY